MCCTQQSTDYHICAWHSIYVLQSLCIICVNFWAVFFWPDLLCLDHWCVWVSELACTGIGWLTQGLVEFFLLIYVRIVQRTIKNYTCSAGNSLHNSDTTYNVCISEGIRRCSRNLNCWTISQLIVEMLSELLKFSWSCPPTILFSTVVLILHCPVS